MVELNAQDVFQICSLTATQDTLGMLSDGEFMRGLANALERSDQTVLSPFQLNIVTAAFARGGIGVKCKELAVPEEDLVSPESLLNVLKSMVANSNRNERHLKKILQLMENLLPEFNPQQLSQTIQHLSLLKYNNGFFYSAISKRCCEIGDDLSPANLCEIITGLTYGQAPHNAILSIFQLIEKRMKEFMQDDVHRILEALIAGGPKYVNTLTMMVLNMIDVVETLSGPVLATFLVAMVRLDYRNRAHAEIFADSLVERVSELTERQLISSLGALHSLSLVSQSIFREFEVQATKCVPRMDCRNMAPLIDILSMLPFRCEELMELLLARIAATHRQLSHRQLGDVLDVMCGYPPAKQHPVVEVLGRHCKGRMDLLGPASLAQATHALSVLGYGDTDYYLEAAVTFQRWGYKDYSMVESILQGLCVHGHVDVKVLRIISSHLVTMAPQLSIKELERASRYLAKLGCDDDEVYRALVDRLRVFVREVTPDMPTDLQQLLQRGSVAEQNIAAKEAQTMAQRSSRHASNDSR